MTTETCEWNPATNSPAMRIGGRTIGCDNVAVVSVGKAPENWHLCARCSELPEFRKYRTRARIEELKAA